MQDKWSEYWQNESATGECFVDKNGKKNPELAEFWKSNLRQSNKQFILDLASGAGSIFVGNEEVEGAYLYALDFSSVALKQLKSKVKHCQSIQASASQIPFKKHTFDKVVSQFGVEYAGVEAIINAFHYLKKGGQLTFLCHCRDGFIDSRNAIEQAGANLCQSIDFVTVAKNVTEAMLTNDEANITSTLSEFQQVEPKLAEFVNMHQFGVHYHLYTGFKQLFLNRHKYYLKDITNWLDGMQSEIQKTKLRMLEMRNAALDKEQVSYISEQFRQLGAKETIYKPFQLSGHNKPVAWLISANR